jgi:two-component system LytT family response regulator
VEKLKAIIIDDSPQARKLLRLMLQELAPNVELLKEAENVPDGLKAIEEYQPDFIFLDIEMPGKSGIQLAEELVEKKITCDIVFTTAYNNYAINAFRLAAIDYLLKPVQEKQLLEAVQKIEERKSMKLSHLRFTVLAKNMNAEGNQTLAIPVQGGYEYITLKDIEYLEADGSYVHLFMIDKKQKTVSKNLKYFEQQLQEASNFIRVHRSFIINMKHISSFSRAGRGTILMKNSRSIDLARDRREAFLTSLEK